MTNKDVTILHQQIEIDGLNDEIENLKCLMRNALADLLFAIAPSDFSYTDMTVSDIKGMRDARKRLAELLDVPVSDSGLWYDFYKYRTTEDD